LLVEPQVVSLPNHFGKDCALFVGLRVAQREAISGIMGIGFRVDYRVADGAEGGELAEPFREGLRTFREPAGVRQEAFSGMMGIAFREKRAPG
jgi:hypothetical protein